jgi:CheY-like chemotaxis protein
MARGIPAELLPNIFDLFVQGGAAFPGHKSGGLGLELALAKRLAELHGGSIEVSSAGVGRGSRFTVRLPLAAPQAPTAPIAGEAPRSQGVEGRRFLVVDDNPLVAEGLAALLGVAGQDVQMAYDGAAALEMARAPVPDVMLVDLSMPGMDGFEVARRARQDPLLAGALLAALTGHVSGERHREALDAGFDVVLLKPTDADTLLGLGKRPAGRG